jgi:hypothetical protein
MVLANPKYVRVGGQTAATLHRGVFATNPVCACVHCILSSVQPYIHTLGAYIASLYNVEGGMRPYNFEPAHSHSTKKKFAKC